MKLAQLFIAALMVLGFAHKSQAALVDDDCEMPENELLLIYSLTDALNQTIFPDCRFGIDAHSLVFQRGGMHDRVNLMRRRTQVTPVNGTLVVKGYRPDDEDGDVWTESKFTFVLSSDQKKITRVDYAESTIENVNIGTVLRPRYEVKSTQFRAAACNAQ